MQPGGLSPHPAYDIRGIPFYVVIDQAGKIVSTGHDWDETAAVALKLIGE
jgi:hypothetical protein